MRCQEAEVLIQLNIDACLPPELRPQLEAHLAACPDCARLAAELARVDSLLAAEITQVPVPAGLTAAVMARLPQRAPAPAPRLRRRQWLRVAGGLAAALLLFVGVYALTDSGAGPQPPVIAVVDPPAAPVDPPVEPLDPVDPPVAPVDPVDPPVAPMDPVDPVVEPQDPVDPADPLDPPAEPVEPVVEAPPPTYSHGIPLPPVAASSEIHGSYDLITLAFCPDFDVLCPQVSGDTVTYYIAAEDAYLEYQTSLNATAENSFIGETDGLPGAGGYGKKADSEEKGSYRTATAITGQVAENRNDGLYLVREDGDLLAEARGGGSLLSWAPDGNKVLFSDANGNLLLYYPTENQTLELYTGVTSLAWAGNNHIVFAAPDPSTGHSSIFRVTVP